MLKRKYLILLPFLLIFILSGCSSNAPSKQQNNKKSSQSISVTKDDKGITALKAWKKVKKEVNKWDANSKLVKIKDRSYASFQRQNGLADVWEFLVDQCQAKNERHNYCNKGKSRSFLYSTTKGGWGPKGISAESETISSYSVPIDLNKLKIDTDKAVELARKGMGQKPNANEEFIISTYTSEDGTVYWEIHRQCWSKGADRQACNSADGYTVYVNAETGEVLKNKPRDN